MIAEEFIKFKTLRRKKKRKWEKDCSSRKLISTAPSTPDCKVKLDTAPQEKGSTKKKSTSVQDFILDWQLGNFFPATVSFTSSPLYQLIQTAKKEMLQTAPNKFKIANQIYKMSQIWDIYLYKNIWRLG